VCLCVSLTVSLIVSVTVSVSQEIHIYVYIPDQTKAAATFKCHISSVANYTPFRNLRIMRHYEI